MGPRASRPFTPSSPSEGPQRLGQGPSTSAQSRVQRAAKRLSLAPAVCPTSRDVLRGQPLPHLSPHLP